MIEAAKLVAIVRAKGSDTDNLRDAAHEAHHALDTNLTKPWTRNNIHMALERKARSRSDLIAFELDARAVEWLVCDHFKVKYDADEWANIAWWETIKAFHIELPSTEWILDCMRKRKQYPSIKRAVDRVLGLLDDRAPVDKLIANGPAFKRINEGKLGLVAPKRRRRKAKVR